MSQLHSFTKVLQQQHKSGHVQTNKTKTTNETRTFDDDNGDNNIRPASANGSVSFGFFVLPDITLQKQNYQDMPNTNRFFN
jgi:hypothetical protein